MRTFLCASVIFIAAAASTACVLPAEPTDLHPACAQIGVGSNVEINTSLGVQLDSALVELTHCTAVVAPGVRASGFDAEATIHCWDGAGTVTLDATVSFADFRSATVGSKAEARGAATLVAANAGYGYSGTAEDRAAITIESRSGTVNGDDVSPGYELRGVLRLQVTKATLLQSKGRHLTLQPSTIELPFTWTQAAFRANYDRCPV